MGADSFEFFSGIILIFKDKVNIHGTKGFIICRLFTEAAWLLLHIFFSRLCIKSGFPLAA
jgi:hypothetical protein